MNCDEDRAAPGSVIKGREALIRRATWLFLRLLGLTYLLAFWSLHTQILGLIGHDGILPAARYMARAQQFVAAEQVGLDRFRLLPTLCWLSASDEASSAPCVLRESRSAAF